MLHLLHLLPAPPDWPPAVASGLSSRAVKGEREAWGHLPFVSAEHLAFSGL